MKNARYEGCSIGIGQFRTGHFVMENKPDSEFGDVTAYFCLLREKLRKR